jgi:hypothetical protein
MIDIVTYVNSYLYCFGKKINEQSYFEANKCKKFL